MSQIGATRLVGYFSSHLQGAIVEKLLNTPGLFSKPCARGYFILGIFLERISGARLQSALSKVEIYLKEVKWTCNCAEF